MVTKELIEARWKLVAGLVLMVLCALLTAYTYQLIVNLITAQGGTMPDFLRDYISRMTTNFNTYIWASWFTLTNNGGLMLLVLSTILGSGLIAGEVSKGTIFLLLSKPLTRTRVLLIKYGVSAAILLAVLLLGSLVVLLATALQGRAQPIGGMLVSTLLFWLGMLFTLGMATLFSTIFNDVLRPIAFALVVVLLLSIPSFFSATQAFSLPSYWVSLPAYLEQAFPLKEFVVSLVAAAVPLAAAVWLFRKQQY